MQMVEHSQDTVVKPERSHKCSFLCLGRLTFHEQALGDMVHLSQGCRHAKRSNSTFKNGLVFSSRPVRVQERIRLWVAEDVANWHGAMRLGFTNVPPEDRSQPLPCMAVPILTDTPGHWAAPVHETYCQAGSELEFWVSHSGRVYFSNHSGRRHELLRGVDLSRPLWAMIDIYGQTCAIVLLGSKKKARFYTKRSCKSLTSPMSDTDSLISDDSIPCLNLEVTTDGGEQMTCVVCMSQEVNVSLHCGHRCLCRTCAGRVFKQFGTCPLCRKSMRWPLGAGPPR
uniref:E3 ubiquitin-protein ligase NEURL3 n=1 Tax=Doryrhamphus excisus TaxID=161450 RepID=UPI0025AE6E0E|nr:E3 ubiquitin-protein ligase NEURL3 [Doryrhamphus excisus]